MILDMLKKIICFVISILWITNGNVIGVSEIDNNTETLYHRDQDIFFQIIHPPELEFTYRIRPAKDFGVPFNSSLSMRSIALVPVDPPTNCQLPNNAEQLKNNVAFIQRGECSFELKTAMAEKAGALAAIIADYPISMEEDRISPIWTDYHFIEMTSDNSDDRVGDIKIPAGFLQSRNGRIIRYTLRQLHLSFALINIPVNLTFTNLDEYRQPPWVLL